MIELLNHTNPDQSSSWYRWLIMHKKWKGINFVTVTFVDRSLSFVVTIQYAPHRHRWKHTPQGPTASTFHSVINSVSDWHPVSFQVSEWLFNLFQKIFFFKSQRRHVTYCSSVCQSLRWGLSFSLCLWSSQLCFFHTTWKLNTHAPFLVWLRIPNSDGKDSKFYDSLTLQDVFAELAAACRLEHAVQGQHSHVNI